MEVLIKEIIDFNGPFSSKPCLMTPEGNSSRISMNMSILFQSILLVGGFNPSENISQLGSFPVYGKKTCSKAPTRFVINGKSFPFMTLIG